MGLFFCLFVVCCYAKLKINGLVLVSYQQTNETNSAMRMLQDAFSIVGPNGWVSIVVQFTQSNINSTSINVSADSLSRLQESVNAAKSLGLHVIVKPHVDLSQDPLHWRGEIGKYFDDAAWAAWFSSYKSMMKSVAGSSKGAEALNIGTELTLTQSREQNWRDVISLARNFFPGILCYGSNHGNESSIKWWDALDWIGVDAYYPLGNDSSVDALVQSWNGIFSTILNPLAAKFKKPIVFTEVGYQSVTGAAITPWVIERERKKNSAD
jgi:hypothetical protein